MALRRKIERTAGRRLNRGRVSWRHHYKIATRFHRLDSTVESNGENAPSRLRSPLGLESPSFSVVKNERA